MDDRNDFMINLSREQATTTDIGQEAELIASEYLKKHGLSYVEKNFHSRYGEIDLIMKDQNILVFVEVRYRKSTNTMHALESITHAKCERIIKTAEYYIQSQKKPLNIDYRIDVISMSGEFDNAHIDWIQNAIQA